ncbi:putative RNA-binding protein 19 [Sciurus carolinensis]|uniref:RNA-binding protein 19 n=1 Tax=Sciurus carolinensis TaxID=30640 RepID=A0AA41SWM5_SCICA|nr:putative RNA-binding protein 19 [Sciurus carolinensis]
MEYLKSKMVAAKSSSEKESEDEAVNCDEGSEAEESSTTETQQTEKAANEKESPVQCHRGGRYIKVFREKHVPTAKGPLQNSRTLGKNEEEEGLADSRRLFVSNLPYTSTVEDLEGLFSSYGPLSELHYPINSLTKKPQGFAFITLMFPEHALRAYMAADGQVFQLRAGCYTCCCPPSASEDADTPRSSYKKKAASKDKASSSSSHNWNILFMGPNAVTEAITQKYIATKYQVHLMAVGLLSSLPQETKGSVAVRVAPGETQLVQEVHRFLLHNGVNLDSFNQAIAERSKSMILAKNLPAGTLAAELWETFSHFGSLGRVLLPKGGVTAIIVEFLEPLEFHHIPLYLKWAPCGVFSSTAPQRKELQEAPAKSAEKNEVEPEMGKNRSMWEESRAARKYSQDTGLTLRSSCTPTDFSL